MNKLTFVPFLKVCLQWGGEATERRGEGRGGAAVGRLSVGVWEGVVVGFLKYRWGPPCRTLIRPAGGPPLMARVAHLQGG
jgi:hypothetical protein